MKKTTVYLEPELDLALGRLAVQRRVSKAEVIRAALRDAARESERPRIAAIDLARGPGDVADNVDRHLTDSGFGGA